MSYAPQSILDVARLWTAHGGSNLGIVGDTAHQGRPSYHNGKDVITRYGRTCANDYSICHPRDVAGLSDAASALDLGPGAAGFGALRDFTRRLGAAVVRGDPDTKDIRDVLGTDDGVTVRCWISPQVSGKTGTILTGCADSSHLTHTHISWFRDSRDHDLTPVFRRLLEQPAAAPAPQPPTATSEVEMIATVTVKPFPQPVHLAIPAGATVEGYDPARPGKPVVTRAFGSPTGTWADATVEVLWSGYPAGTEAPVPRGGPFLRVTEGVYKGLLVPASQVQWSPPPDPCDQKIAAALERVRAAALDAVGKAIDSIGGGK